VVAEPSKTDLPSPTPGELMLFGAAWLIISLLVCAWVLKTTGVGIGGYRQLFSVRRVGAGPIRGFLFLLPLSVLVGLGIIVAGLVLMVT